MTFLNTIPLIGAVIAVLLGFIVLTNKGQPLRSRLILSSIVCLLGHNLLESYFFYHKISWLGLGLSYLHYHLIGALFLVYSYLTFKVSVNLKFWGTILVIYTLLRLVLLAGIHEEVLERPDDFEDDLFLLILDYFIAIFFNVLLLLIAFQRIRKIHFAVRLKTLERLSIRWLHVLLILSIFMYVFIMVSGALSLLDEEEWWFYEKMESVLISIFLLLMTFSAIRFPVFAIHGDFKDVPKASKYAKSSLTSKDVEEIWEEIDGVMGRERPYRNSEYRLNDLAQRVGRSVHHVSQVINEKLNMSFSDFINQLRVEEAQRLLASGRAHEVTILAIAYEAGFNSKTAFYNAFKKFTGKSPKASIETSR